MAVWELAPEVVAWVRGLVWMLDARTQPRVAPVLVGALFAQGRRTVSRWIVAAGVSGQFQRYYYVLGTLGRKNSQVGSSLLGLVRRVVPLPDRILLAIDDTLTKRYGPHVEGAGIHHNATPGPADAKLAYGHVWVTLAWVVRHPRWGTIALPLLAKLYVRAKDIAPLALCSDWTFRTKLELAGELLAWATFWLSWIERPIWVVVDGGYAKRPFLDRARELSITVVGRLRKDAALFDVPPPRTPGQRGRSRKYGARMSLAGRARHRRGWQTGQFLLYGQWVTKTYKTFLATARFVPDPIRVVIVQEEHGWFAWFCTDPSASVADILEAVADRAAIEQVFHDVKEVHGAGQQQLRHVWANIGAWHLLLWLYTLIELWAWHRSDSELIDRTARPWDNQPRRPSHADKAGALRRACLRETFSLRRATRPLSRKIQRLMNQLAALVC